MAISYVGAGTSWDSGGSSGTSLTMNKPSGVASGDLMIAVLAFYPTNSGSQSTVTPPSGWTVFQQAYRYDSNQGDTQLAVLTRTATGSESASWTATISKATQERTAHVVAYRGVQEITSSLTAGATYPTASYSTGTLPNPGSGNYWRFTAACYGSSSTSYDIQSTEVTRRSFETVNGSSGGTQSAVWDSNGNVSYNTTAQRSRTISRAYAWGVSASFIAFLQESTGTPASGGLAAEVPSITADGAGEVHDDGVVSASVPPLSFSGDGYGQPPVGTGTLGADLPKVSVSAEGGTDVSGSLAATVVPSVSFEGETRLFGIRVILVEVDNRVIVVPSRGVDD